MQRLVLFARLPRLGRVKTRLIPTLGAEGALMLYRAFLVDQLSFLRVFRADHDLELCADGPWEDDPDLDPLLEGIQLTLQGSGDLGRRMLRCFRRARREGAGSTLILGADAPTLPENRIVDGFRRLEGGAQAVVCPARDGGYVLVGLVKTRPELFCEVPWGSPRVLRVTLSRAHDAGIDVHQLEPWYDVDGGEDLPGLRDDLSHGGAGARAPETRRCLARLARVDSSRDRVI